MRVNPNSTVPVFKQVVQEIQSSIAAGVYREGESIPSARELAMRLKVNPNTIQKAFDELDSLGVIETRRGIGKFVRKGALRSSTKRSREEILRVFENAIQIASSAGMTRREVDELFRRAAKTMKSESASLKN